MARKLIFSKKDFLISRIPNKNSINRVSIKHLASGLAITADSEAMAWPEMMSVLSNHYGVQIIRQKDESEMD